MHFLHVWPVRLIHIFRRTARSNHSTPSSTPMRSNRTVTYLASIGKTKLHKPRNIFTIPNPNDNGGWTTRQTCLRNGGWTTSQTCLRNAGLDQHRDVCFLCISLHGLMSSLLFGISGPAQQLSNFPFMARARRADRAPQLSLGAAFEGLSH